MIRGVIYKTTNLINGKIYVGQDKHNRRSYLGSSKLINRAIRKYGRENFEKSILCKCSTLEEMNSQEIHWISTLNSQNKHIGYNIAAGGQGGDTLTYNDNREEILHKMSKAKLGKPLTEEHKKNISIRNMGKTLSKKHINILTLCHRTRERHPHTEETKSKISKSMSKRILSEETRLKISKSKTGRKLSEEHKLKISQSQKIKLAKNIK